MHSFIEFLVTGKDVTVFAGLILATALVAYAFWFSRSVQSVFKSVKQLTKALTGDSDEDWSTMRARASDVVKRHANLASTWLETEQRVTLLPVGNRAVPVMFGVPRDIWSPRALLSRRFNLDLAEAVPNILVGVGLFFTFVFLTLALTDTTTALTQSQTSAKDTEEAISNLLKVAGAKFLTSLAGLLASILWTGFSKRALRQVERACDEMLEALGRAISSNGGELLVRHQLAVAEKSAEYGEANVELAEELLNEARDQTGALKRFETDLALSLAEAINPQMQTMTESLVAAIDGLSNKLGAMNQDALEKMLTDFSAQLKQGTETEMAQLQKTLTQLADNLQNAGQSIGMSASGAADALHSAGIQLVTNLGEVTQTLSEGAGDLVQAADSLTGSMTALDATLSNASTVGRRGVIFVTQALEKAGETVDQLAAVSAGLSEAASNVGAAGGRIADAFDSAEELCREQRIVVETVKEFAPQATSAVERVSGLLEDATKRGLEAMQQTRASLNEATGALGKTLTSITEGVTIYSEQVAKLHLDMDSHLAKAVGSFDKGVSELADSIDDLADVVNRERVIQ